MQGLKNYFPLLKKGTSKSNIPFYSGMIKFTENTVETCNGAVNTKVNYKKIRLGEYEHIEDALIARLKAEKKYFKEFAPQRHLFAEYGI